LTSFKAFDSVKHQGMEMLTKELAEFAVNELEKAIIEAQHKLANQANKEYVARLKREMVELLSGD
jgi:intergrase/recombinase